MSRNIAYSALALRVKQSYQSNREAWFLTAEEGIVRATVFGGAKSRLRALVAPFHEGTLMIYHDPVRDSRKVSDFDVRSYRTGLRELYERAMTADALAETVLATLAGGGGWAAAAGLAGSVLDELAEADAAFCARLGIYFLWSWSDILGARPDISACAFCGCEMPRDETLWYYASSGDALFCGRCAAAEKGREPSRRTDLLPPSRLDPGARLWLKQIESLPPAALARITLDSASLDQAKAISKAALAGALEKRLATWDNI
ncbi:MAG: recombination protein O N-terminal domain-containing protein [Treponema sp.]|nr:recombination protein O N-terminal domain-containing protein [Treponema sp.]